MNEGPDERFEAVPWITSSVESVKFEREEDIRGEEDSDDVLEDINTERVRRNR